MFLILLISLLVIPRSRDVTADIRIKLKQRSKGSVHGRYSPLHNITLNNKYQNLPRKDGIFKYSEKLYLSGLLPNETFANIDHWVSHISSLCLAL